MMSYRPERRRTKPGWYAALAFLLGLGALTIGVTEPVSNGVGRGFLVSTIGITAIVTGVHAVREGGQFSRAFGRGGAILGTIGTALMAYALVAFALAPGVVLPSLSLGSIGDATNVSSAPYVQAPPITTPRSTQAQAPATADGATADGATATDDTAATPAAVAPASAPDWTPTTAAEERSQLITSAGTLSFVLKNRFGPGAYPISLVTRAGSPWTIAVDGGPGLGPVPAGARVIYSTSSDGMSWSASIVGAQFGQVATISSAVPTVTIG